MQIGYINWSFILGVIHHSGPVQKQLNKYRITVVSQLWPLLINCQIILGEYKTGEFNKWIPVFLDNEWVMLTHDTRVTEYFIDGIQAIRFALEFLNKV